MDYMRISGTENTHKAMNNLTNKQIKNLLNNGFKSSMAYPCLRSLWKVNDPQKKKHILREA